MDTAAPQPPEKTPKRLHKNIIILSLTSLFTDVSSEMLSNLLPLFLVNVLKVRISIVGLIDGIAETTASLVKIYSGVLSDRLGKRKALAVIGYTFSTITKPFLYFANTWGWVLGVRFSDRIGKGIRTAPRDALLAGSTEPQQRGLAFGIHRAGDTAGAFLGLGIATLIIWLTQSGNTELTQSTFRIIVLASIIPAVLAVIILWVGAKEVNIQGNKPKAGSISGWKALDRNFKTFLAIMVLFTLGNSSDSFIILRAQERGLNVLQVMGMLMTFSAVYTLLSGPAGSLSDRLGRRRIILLGWIVYGLVYLGLAMAKTGTQIWLLYAFYGIYYASTEGVAKALVADLVPMERRGAAYGYFNAAIGLSALPASLIAGILWQGLGSWEGFGAHAPFLFGAILAISAGLLFRFLVQQPALLNDNISD
jgi:MFS family permease